MRIVYEPESPRYLVAIVGLRGSLQEHDIEQFLYAFDTRGEADSKAWSERYSHPGQRIAVIDTKEDRE